MGNYEEKKRPGISVPQSLAFEKVHYLGFVPQKENPRSTIAFSLYYSYWYICLLYHTMRNLGSNWELFINVLQHILRYRM